jgi:CRP-like cAMP-binding protein
VLIATSAWFSGAPDEVLDKLVDAARLKQFEKDSHLWTIGTSYDEVFVIVKGRVRMYAMGLRGREYALADRGEGAWLGVACLKDDREPEFAARALVDSDVLVIPRTAVLEAGRDWPRLYHNLFQDVVDSSRGIFSLLARELFYPLRGRVGLRLMELADEYGEPAEGGILINIRVSQNDIASLAGGSRQRINRIFRDWEERGLVDSRGEYLLIRSLEAFQRELEPFD